jgi:hypothetical protein
MRENNAHTQAQALQPMEPSQLMLRVLAVVLAVVPLSLLLTAAAWSPLRSTSLLEHEADRVRASANAAPAFSQARPTVNALVVPAAE